ncbi:hypothetical protein ASPACDRAFT_80857 [Aspergillus aculeatus ATCC 16872]|uniref:Wings apart-like protein C-terminal domain-containing protein n=1 Tax=Aspergillus aculeatus (strain ATCC 16872 / CBS 172.66 / WB 5094) TaxID=690307 RepID=A0A1L9WKL7_ASPA1|nr:uncharacterized protein ASPACDRAFT_80857 [Aspergillus aculeatus ATCC 16872]OJJ96698.1 hypothetical protein ASPACDRAFT_80857 [Aspergillus aculeatus ATCC 16872]
MPERALRQSKSKTPRQSARGCAPSFEAGSSSKTHDARNKSIAQANNSLEATPNSKRTRAHKPLQQKRQRLTAPEQLTSIRSGGNVCCSYDARQVGMACSNELRAQSCSAISDASAAVVGNEKNDSHHRSSSISSLVAASSIPLSLASAAQIKSDCEASVHSLRSSPISNHVSQTRDRPERNMLTVPYQQRVRPTRRRLVDSLSAAEESVLNEVSASDSETCGANTSSVLGISQSKAGAVQLDQVRDQQGPVKSPSNDREAGPSVSSTLLRSRITYARQRSFLGSTLNTSDSELHGASASALDGDEAGASSASLKHRSTLLLSAADGEEHGRPVRSIHELRQAGDNARFQESVDALFDDFEDPGNTVSERCNGLIQLCSKLLKPDFMHRFLEYGFDERLVKSTVSDLDIISSCLALCAYRLVYLKGVYSYSNLGTFWTTLVDKSSLLLAVKDDIMSLAGNPRLHVSRAVQALLRDLIPRLTASIFSEGPTPRLSPRLVILSCISICLTAFQDKSQPIQSMSRSLLDNLIGLLPPNNGEATAYPLSYDDFQTRTMTLLVLESYLMLPATPGYDYNGSFHKFVLMHDDFIRPAQDDQGRRILTLYLRVVLNLTNNDPLASEQYAAPEIITGFVRIITTELSDASSTVGFGEHESFNLVILALGVLINLAEQSESCRASFLEPMHDSYPPLETLAHQFSLSIDLIKHANSLSESHNNVAVGYLSILLALLCLRKEAYFRIQELLMECGKEIASVISTAKEFLVYHQKVERDSRLGELQNRDNTSTARLTHIIEQISQP